MGPQKYFKKNIFDNVVNLEIGFKPYMPTKFVATEPKLLITSRHQEWESFSVLQLKELTTDEANKLVKDTLIEPNNDEIKMLIEKLHNFPLALQQSISFIKQERKRKMISKSDYTIAQYIRDFDQSMIKLLDHEYFKNSKDIYDKTILTTWTMTVDTIRQHPDCGNLAISILNMMSYMQPNKIQTTIFLRMKSPRDNIEDAILLLKEYSMIEVEPGELDIHELVQKVTRYAASEEIVLREALSLIQDSREMKSVHWLCEYAGAHEKLVLDFIDYQRISIAGCGLVGQYDKVIKMSDNILKFWSKLPIDDKIIVSRYKSSALQHQQEFSEACKVLENIHKEVIDAQTTKTIIKLKMDLAKLYSIDGRISEANKLFLQVAESESLLSLSQSVLHNLAISNDKLGNYDKAIEFYEKSIAFSANTDEFYKYYPSTLSMKNRWADLLVKTKKMERALEIYQEIYSDMLKMQKLPDIECNEVMHTLQIERTIANLLQEQDKVIEANEMFKKIMAKEKVLQIENTVTDNLKRSLEKQDKDTVNSPIKCLRMNRKRNVNNCLFSKKDVEQFSIGEIDNRKAINIDSKKFLKFIKKNPNERMNSQLLQLVESDHVHTDDNYKFMLENVVNQRGYEHSTINERMNGLFGDIHNDHSSTVKRKTKLKSFTKISGRIMMIHGIYGTIVTCSKGNELDCGLSVGGIAWSFVSTPIEKAFVAKLTPKLVKLTSRASIRVINVLPMAKLARIIGGSNMAKTLFVVRLLGSQNMAKSLLRGAGAAIGGVFDIVDIGIQGNTLIECSKRQDTEERCTGKEIRDSIVSISFDSISFVAGIALAAASMPVVGVVVGVGIFVCQILYGGISAVIEYNEKYQTTDAENWSIFWRTTFFQEMSSDIKSLVARTEFIEHQANATWNNLQEYPDSVKAFGMGLGYKVNNTHVGVGAIIKLGFRNSKFRTVSRVAPKSIKHANMICLPTNTHEEFEKDIHRYISSAEYYCDNAMVFADSRRNGDTVVLNLEFVSVGEIEGSNEWNNIFVIDISGDEGSLIVNGGNSVTNRFIFRKYPFWARIIGGPNATNIMDFSETAVFYPYEGIIYKFYYAKGHFRGNCDRNNIINYANFDDRFNEQSDFRTYLWIGRTKRAEHIYCTMENSWNGLLIHTGGGIGFDEYDEIRSCRKVILSPFSNVSSSTDQEHTIYVKTNDYKGTNLKSIVDIKYGSVYIIFSEFELLSGDTTFMYFPNEKLLHIALCFDDNQFVLEIWNFDYRPEAEVQFNLLNKHKHRIVPRFSQLAIKASQMEVTSFELHILCSKELLANVTAGIYDHRIAKKLKVLTTIQFDDTVSYVVGSEDRDVFYFNDKIIFARGGDGEDVYIVNEYNSEIKRELTIFNDARDNKLDFIMMPSVPRTFSVCEKSILVSYNTTTIKVQNFQESVSNQHLVFINNNKGMEAFIPLLDTNRLVPFIQATPMRNVFVLQMPLNDSEIVIDALVSDLEIYKDKNNLLILRPSTQNPLIITMKDFFLDMEKWNAIAWFLYNNGTITRCDDLIYKDGIIMDYKLKIKQDYLDTFKEYVRDFNASDYIAHNNLNYQKKRLGVLIIESISPENIVLSRNKHNLMLIDRVSKNTIEIEDWDLREVRRISTVEFTEPLESIAVRGLERFSLEQIQEMQILFDKAAENFDMQRKFTPLTSIGVKCLISINGFDQELSTYTCAGFNSVNEQIQFVETFCQLETLEMFTRNATMTQIRALLTQLKNDIILHGYDFHMSNKCEQFFNVSFLSEYFPNEELFKLHDAVLTGKIDIVQSIVKEGIDVNLIDWNNNTALDYVFTEINKICETVDGNIIYYDCRNDKASNFQSELHSFLQIADYLISESAVMEKHMQMNETIESLYFWLNEYQGKYPNAYRVVDSEYIYIAIAKLPIL